MIFQKSIMVAVATAGQSTASVSTARVCERTEGDTFPMLFLVPRLHALYTPFDGVYSPPLPPPPPPERPHDLPWYLPTRGGLAWRISGASHEFGMLGLGDIVLPALTLAFARRVDLAQQADAATAPLPARLQPRRVGCANGCGGYFVWGVAGYALGLAVTLAANAYGWTINDVKGQPALLYLVPGVLGALTLRSALRGETAALFSGTSLIKTPTSPPTPNDDGTSSDGATSADGAMWRLLKPRRSE